MNMSEIAVIPQPVHMMPKEGVFTLTPGLAVVAAGQAEDVAKQFCALLAPALGIKLEVSATVGKQRAVIFEIDGSLERLGREGYTLSIAPQQVVARAAQPAGLFYALQTIRQLLPAVVFASERVKEVNWVIPCCEIEDAPRFAWRGAMLDVCRHFMPKEFIFRFIDLLALHKLNVFHWHLTEDQGWRIEIKKYPRLTEVGAWRKETLIGHARESEDKWRFDGIPHGGFYTQQEVKEVVAYAAARYIRVMPEIEMPGHAQAAVASYPQLGNTGRQLEVSTGWGIHEDIFNVEESTIHFLQDVLNEVLALFPGEFIHIGGDEVPKKRWQESPAAQARMKSLGLQNEDELQSYFIHRMDEFLTARGRRLVGWDEILEGGLAPNATVMSWRGEEGGIAAANAGHDVVMAPWHSTYLDYYQSEDREKEPLAIGGFLPLEKVYAFDPVSAQIKPQDAHHVLGVQAQLWTEYIPNPAHVEYMAFPRLCALSEVAWTPLAVKDYASFSVRLKAHLARLDQLKVNYRPLDPTA
jgi:hexosaminidase